MRRFLPTDAWIRWTLVPMLVFMAMVSDHGYLADFWHHLARGRAMVQSGSLVDQDQFTFTVFGEPFQDVNWLSQLIYYGLYQLGGLALVQVVNALFLAGTLALLIEVCRRRSGSLFWSSLVVAGVFIGVWHVLTIRPQTFSLFLFVLLLDLLERAEHRPSLLLLPPLLLALWTNLHGAFPAGLMLIGCFFLAACCLSFRKSVHETINSVVKSSNWLQLGLCLGASTLATLVNPYGWGIYLYVGQTSQRSIVRRIDEWMPPSWDLLIGKAFFVSLIVLAVLGVLAWRARHGIGRATAKTVMSLRDGLLLGCFLILACSSVRMVAWWLLILAPVAAAWLARLWPQERTVAETTPSLAAGLTFAAMVLLTVFSLPGLQRFQPLLVLRQQPRVEDDLDAVRLQLADHLPEGRVGKVFSRFEWGEYLSWSYSPQVRVFMDGRIEIFPDEVWNQYAHVTQGVADWQQILDDYQVDALLLDSDYHARTGLLTQVEGSPRWHKQFTARTALLYLRTGAK